jgi:hypothetical protein
MFPNLENINVNFVVTLQRGFVGVRPIFVKNVTKNKLEINQLLKCQRINYQNAKEEENVLVVECIQKMEKNLHWGVHFVDMTQINFNYVKFSFFRILKLFLQNVSKSFKDGNDEGV